MKYRLPEILFKRFPILSFLLFFSVLAVFGQDVQFPQAVISSGGGNSSSGPVNLTRWRIGQINVVTLPSGNNLKQASAISSGLSPESKDAWSVSVYPNPVNKLLHVHFEMDTKGEFSLEIYDVSGRKLIAKNGLMIIPGQVAEIDLTGLTPTLYLLKVIPASQRNQKLFKITKQ